jgi:hypothetical protein
MSSLDDAGWLQTDSAVLDSICTRKSAVVFISYECFSNDYKKNKMSTDRESGGGKQKGKSDKRITESKARQKESTTLCTNLAG